VRKESGRAGPSPAYPLEVHPYPRVEKAAVEAERRPATRVVYVLEVLGIEAAVRPPSERPPVGIDIEDVVRADGEVDPLQQSIAKFQVGNPFGVEPLVVRAECFEVELVGRKRGRGFDSQCLAIAGRARSYSKITDVAVGAEHDLALGLTLGEAQPLFAAEQDQVWNFRERTERVQPLVDLGLVAVEGGGQQPIAQ